VIDRIEPVIPYRFDNTFRKVALFKAEIEFMYTSPLTGVRSINFELSVNTGATGSVFIDEQEVITIPKNEILKSVSCPLSSLEVERDQVTGEFFKSGCCIEPEYRFRYIFNDFDAN